MELILFDKYLIRGVERNYTISKVKPGKLPVVIEVVKSKEKSSTDSITRDYSNFSSEKYPGTFSNCLRWIKQDELTSSDIRSLDQLNYVLGKIDANIELVAKAHEVRK